MKIEQNISRLRYLLDLYKITVNDLLDIINDGLKKPIKKEEIFSSEINLNYLKRIDKVFNKGLHYYLDPKTPEASKDASIFFRKHKFDVELNIGAKKIVNQFEEFKISLSAIAKLAELNIDRKLPVYTISQPPKEVAQHLRKALYPQFIADKKEFLKALISKFAENNILVFEFVETWNKIEKANIDGFFLNPNVIVLKRQQTGLSREIFTLIHELGHFLLNEEEIEKLDYQDMAKPNLSSVERWCNDFAYYFLIGNYSSVIDKIENADQENDYQFELVQDISRKTNLSQLAIFTRLLFQNKITPKNYTKVKSDLEAQFKAREDAEKLKRELEKQQGIPQRGSTPKPINSPLLISTIQTAFYEGIINEYEVCKRLNIKPENLEKYIQ